MYLRNNDHVIGASPKSVAGRNLTDASSNSAAAHLVSGLYDCLAYGRVKLPLSHAVLRRAFLQHTEPCSPVHTDAYGRALRCQGKVQ